MANKGIPEIPLFDPFMSKMDCPLFGVTTVDHGAKKCSRKNFEKSKKVITCCKESWKNHVGGLISVLGSWLVKQ